MAYEQRDNSGSLFRNDKKEKENHPDYKGSAMIGGVEYWLSAWIKEPRGGGQKFMSLALKPKEQDRQEYKGRGDTEPRGGGGRGQLSDDVPFSPCVD